MTEEDSIVKARDHSWAAHGLNEALQPGDQGDDDTRPTSVQLREARADANRHLDNSRHLTSLLERIARTLGADPLDLDELPALVDGCRTTTDQLRIKTADLAHAVDRAEAGTGIWKTRLQTETGRLRDDLHKARTAASRAEAEAGAHRLAHDHLAAVTRRLIDTVAVHAYSLDKTAAEHLLDSLVPVRDTLARDLRSYLEDPDDPDDLTPDTRVDLTPAGQAAARPASCPTCLSTDPHRRNVLDLGGMLDTTAYCGNAWHSGTATAPNPSGGEG